MNPASQTSRTRRSLVTAFFCALIASFSPSRSNAAVVAGDIAFVGVNATDPDQFAILAVNAIAGGDTFIVTDGGYTGTTTTAASTTFRSTEGFLQYTAPAGGITKGSVLLFTGGGGVAANAAVARNGGGAAGSVSLLANTTPNTTNFTFSSSGDSLTAYTISSGTHLSGAPTLIAFICFGPTPYGTGGANLTSVPTIANGQVLDVTNLDNAIFTSATTAYSQTIAALNSASNFSARDTTAYDLTTLSSAPAVSMTPAVNLSVNSNTGSEAGTTVITVTATSSAAVAGDKTVSLAVTGAGITAGDYVLSNSTITIPGGATIGTVTFKVLDDALLEGTETATLTISAPSAGIVLGATTSRNVMITDNETSVDLSKYVRVGRYDLPEPTRTTPPANNLLAQEASGVTYNWDTNTLFIVGDGSTSVTEVTKTGVLVSSMTLHSDASTQVTDFADTEGITYVGGGQFVMTEERDRQAVKFTYVAGGTLTRAAAQTVKLGTTIGNIGLEGVTYDPQTSGFIFVKEISPIGIFQTTIDFAAGTASNGAPSAANSTNLFNPALANLEDTSDVFAFATIPALAGQPDAGNLLILSQESGLIRNVDRAGNILSTLTLVSDAGNPLSIQNQTHEGITMDRDGVIYVVNEAGGGDTDHPQLWVFALSVSNNASPSALTLSTASALIPENTPTTEAVKLASILVTDSDGVGVNQLSVSGPDSAAFEIIGNGLYLKAGTTLSFTTKPSYNVTVNVDDNTIGNTPDAFSNFTLNLSSVGGGVSYLRVTEVAPWSSGNSPVTADWFELTNTGTSAITITGWKMYDSGVGGFGSAGPLNGITTIAAGESVIFVDGQTKISLFITNWFGAGGAPAGLQIGYYGGPGLSSGGDAVKIYDAGGTERASVAFGASTPAPGPYLTFDNATGLNNATLSVLSAVGTNGAFNANSNTVEIGSPGTATVASTALVSIIATDSNAAETGSDTGTFRITRTGSTTLAMDVVVSIATGIGQAIGADYSPALPSPITIPAGQSFVDLTLTPVNDGLAETAETITLTLGDTGTYDVGSPASATITIAASFIPSQTWRQLYFNTIANTGLFADAADYDGDGVSNLLEYALGGDPTIATDTEGTGLLPIGTAADASDALLSDRFSLAFVLDNPSPTDLTYTVEATSDLANWTPVAAKTGAGNWTWLGVGASHVVTSGTTAVTVKVGDLVTTDGNPRRMMRLKVTAP